MSNLTMLSSSDSASLSVPKLRDDRSNWTDYEPCLWRAMGAKGLWIYVEGKATAPKPYVVVNDVYVLADTKTPALDNQIEAREMCIIEYDKCKSLAQHVILSTTPLCIGS